MKVLHMCTQSVNINGVEMEVPDCEYISIGMYGTMLGWQKKPYVSEGNYYSDTEDPIVIARVQIEEEDVRWQLFSVRLNRFLTYDDVE